MKKLFDETFTDEEQKTSSRHLWYGYLDLYIEGEYGKQIVLDNKLIEIVYKLIKKDMQEKIEPLPTEVNWYLYGKTQTIDAIDDKIRPTIMLRYKDKKFLIRCNVSDHDFAMNIDDIISFEKRLEGLLLE